MKSAVRLTEKRNPASRDIDLRPTREILRIINAEDARVAAAVRREISAIARAVDAIAAHLGRGGRLFYVGAGTSGRLAVLDAAECPPTFNTPRGQVAAILSGGKRAMWRSVEGAEDSVVQGRRDLQRLKPTKKDVVVGLSASGSTPYTLAALRLARARGAFTVAVTSNRNSPLARAAAIAISPETGPEVIAGSTRMKAGTAQKLVLNMLSTAAMIRLGHVYSNLMVNVRLTNRKLRERGKRILMAALGVGERAAEHAVRTCGGDLKAAMVMLRRRCTLEKARQALRAAGGNLRQALGS